MYLILIEAIYIYKKNNGSYVYKQKIPGLPYFLLFLLLSSYFKK